MRSLGLKKNLIIFTTLMFTISLTVMGYIAHELIQEQVSAKVEQKLHDTVLIESQKIESEFANTISTVKGLAELYQSNDIHIAQEKLMAYTVKLASIYKVLVGFDDGSSFVSRPSKSFPNGVGLKDKYDPTKRPWYVKAKSSPGLSLSDVFFTKSTGTPMVGVMHTIESGVILADIRLNHLQDRLVEIAESVGEKAIIVDDSGAVLASTIDNIAIKDNLSSTELSGIDLTKEQFFEATVNGIEYVVVSDSLPLGTQT